jgi:5'-nucleotidase
LLTNDDGIDAPGIKALWQELVRIAEITVVAPDGERSASSQAITVHQPIRVDSYCIDHPHICGWRIGGTPTDCVKLGVETLMPEPPDLVVSGINQGSNMGTDVLYSGTVSAAIEGALNGIPSIAVSLDTWQPFDFAPAAQFTAKLVQAVIHHALPPNTLLNVNVPALPIEKLGDVVITKLGTRQYENTFERRLDPRGRTYYWMGGSIVDIENEQDSDVIAIKTGKISVTPVHFDLTNYAMIDLLKGWNL